MNLQEVITNIHPADTRVLALAQARQQQLTKPPGSLGRLETLGNQLASIYGTVKPGVTGKGVAIFAADHGVTDEGVSAFPKAVTRQMVLNFLHDGAAVNQLAKVHGAALRVVDVGVDAEFNDHARLDKRKIAPGSQNMLHAPALSTETLYAAIAVGVDTALTMIDDSINVLVGGEMGIGNTTAAAAITAVMTGTPVEMVTGRGTGINDATLQHKQAVIKAALETHAPDPTQPLDVLSSVGGLEIAALTGFYLAAAMRRVPVILDGFIATSAALIAAALSPHARDYFVASHVSQEPGHKIQLEALGLTALFDLDLRLGEASGGVLALGMVESAAALLSDMATFEEAGIAT